MDLRKDAQKGRKKKGGGEGRRKGGFTKPKSPGSIPQGKRQCRKIFRDSMGGSFPKKGEKTEACHHKEEGRKKKKEVWRKSEIKKRLGER